MTTLLCYEVTDHEADFDDDDATMIIFAKSDIAARKRYANQHDYPPDTLAGITVKRRADWDQYAPGPVPWLTRVDAGWWVECAGCNVRIAEEDFGERIGHDDDDWNMAREYGPDISRPIMRPIEPKRGVPYCCQQCYDDDMAERRRVKRMTAAAIRIAIARLAVMHPGVTALDRPGCADRHVYVTRDWRTGKLLVHDIRIACTFPGMMHNASIHMSDEKWRHARTPDYAPQTKSNSRPMWAAREREWSFWVANGDHDAWSAFKAGTIAPAIIAAGHHIHEATQ